MKGCVTDAAGFSQNAFAFKVDPQWLVVAVVAAIAMGLVGGLLPAWHAARTPITAALRDA